MSPGARTSGNDETRGIETTDVETPTGPARLHHHRATAPEHGTVVLGHGAGGGIGAVDLVALAEALPAAGWGVVLVEMPWRVAGKRMAPPPRRLDEGWLPVLEAVTASSGGRLVVGGRSAGARVACRTAAQVGAHAVLALSFPLVPPGKGPEKSRIGELATPDEHGLPVLVVQGATDPFGSPEAVQTAVTEIGATGVTVAAVPGAHSFRGAQDALVEATLAFVGEVGRGGG